MCKIKKLILIIPLIVLGKMIYGPSITVSPWALIYTVLNAEPDPIPEVKYAEFPVRLEYKIEGQLKSIEDVVICEFDGIGMNEARGKYRKWKSHLASGNKELVILEIDDSTKIIYYPGSADYFMGDDSYGGKGEFRNAILDDKGSIRRIDADELLMKYHIEIIKWECPEPIKPVVEKK